MEELEKDMGKLADIKEELDKLDPIRVRISALKSDMSEIKDRVFARMQEFKSKRTEAIRGYFMVRENRQTVTVTDPMAVIEWLKANEFEVKDFVRIDPLMIKTVAEAALETTGEIMPGVQIDVKEVASLRKAKS